jgi:hypothetical protein
MNKKDRIIVLLLSCIVCVLICIGSYNGLTTADFYNQETANWKAQSIGQDMINLFLICPFLLITAVMVFLKKEYAMSLWAGALSYLIYTYLIYCFDIHFNNYFILYCLILGLCFYLFVYCIYSQIQKSNLKFEGRKIDKINAFYFLIISISFYFLWLLDIIPAMLDNVIPQGVLDGGLFTNPVHVIDLSIFLPGIFITGVLLLNQKPLGRLFSPILLTFFILMDFTIALLTIVMTNEGVSSGYTVAYVMAFLGLFSLALLLKTLKAENI